jgi:peptidoglycan/LPS O-acetylase OafA/YrhL
MRLRHRHDGDDADTRTESRDSREPAAGDGEREAAAETRESEREEVVETRETRWDLGSVLATAAGALLVVIGVVALVRTGIDSTWYEPVEPVLGMDHVPLLAAFEIGVGAVLVLAALAGARMLAALVALAVGIAATVVAIEPDVADRDLAIEQEWAVVLAVGGFVVALLAIAARERRRERRVERRPVRAA